MENLNQAEAGILLWIQENLRTEWLDHIMPYVSKINDHGILAIIGVIVLLLWTRYRKVGITAFGSLAELVSLKAAFSDAEAHWHFLCFRRFAFIRLFTNGFFISFRSYGFGICCSNCNVNVYACKIWSACNCGIRTDCSFQTI